MQGTGTHAKQAIHGTLMQAYLERETESSAETAHLAVLLKCLAKLFLLCRCQLKGSLLLGMGF